MNKSLIELLKVNKFYALEKIFVDKNPSWFFRLEKEIERLQKDFPEIYHLIGKTQLPAHHPEGDAFEHTMKVLDDVGDRGGNFKTMFCALMHDIGKGETPKEMLPHHYDHDKKGAEVLDKLMWIPEEYKKAAKFVALNHMKAFEITKSGKIITMIKDLHESGLSVRDFIMILNADQKDKRIPWWLNDETYEKIMMITDDPNNIKKLNIINIDKKKYY